MVKKSSNSRSGMPFLRIGLIAEKYKHNLQCSVTFSILGWLLSGIMRLL